MDLAETILQTFELNSVTSRKELMGSYLYHRITISLYKEES